MTETSWIILYSLYVDSFFVCCRCTISIVFSSYLRMRWMVWHRHCVNIHIYNISAEQLTQLIQNRQRTSFTMSWGSTSHSTKLPVSVLIIHVALCRSRHNSDTVCEIVTSRRLFLQILLAAISKQPCALLVLVIVVVLVRFPLLLLHVYNDYFAFMCCFGTQIPRLMFMLCLVLVQKLTLYKQSAEQKDNNDTEHRRKWNSPLWSPLIWYFHTRKKNVVILFMLKIWALFVYAKRLSSFPVPFVSHIYFLSYTYTSLWFLSAIATLWFSQDCSFRHLLCKKKEKWIVFFSPPNNNILSNSFDWMTVEFNCFEWKMYVTIHATPTVHSHSRSIKTITLFQAPLLLFWNSLYHNRVHWNLFVNEWINFIIRRVIHFILFKRAFCVDYNGVTE